MRRPPWWRQNLSPIQPGILLDLNSNSYLFHGLLNERVKNFTKPQQKYKVKKRETYDNRDSLVVTHPTTNRSIWDLIKAERTGYHVFLSLWPYVTCFCLFRIYKAREQKFGWKVEEVTWCWAHKAPNNKILVQIICFQSGDIDISRSQSPSFLFSPARSGSFVAAHRGSFLKLRCCLLLCAC